VGFVVQWPTETIISTQLDHRPLPAWPTGGGAALQPSRGRAPRGDRVRNGPRLVSPPNCRGLHASYSCWRAVVYSTWAGGDSLSFGKVKS